MKQQACSLVRESRIAGLFLVGQFGSSTCIGIIRSIGKILLLKPGFFLIILRDIDRGLISGLVPGSVSGSMMEPGIYTGLVCGSIMELAQSR